MTPGGRSFGSGYLVAPGLVLTARHVVCGDGRAYGDLCVRFLATDTPLPCHLAWPGRADLDAALLRCDPPVSSETAQLDPVPLGPATLDPARSRPVALEPVGSRAPMRWGQLVASEAGIGCEAAGFPRSMEQDDGLREVEHLRGEINPGTGLLGGRIYADVRSARPVRGGWAGMSGAALCCGPLVVGVVAWDVTAFEAGRLAAEPVPRLFEDPQFREIIGADVAIEAVELAGRRLRVAAPGPAYLLRADTETARFRSRAGELARLASWCEGAGTRVRLLTGAGGQGKTRLARELTARLAATGEWAAEILPEGARLPADIRLPLLAVMDYAETRPDQVRDVVLAALAQPGNMPLRLLLLARGAGDWWDRLRMQTPELEMALAGATVDPLAPLEGTPAGRAQAFSEAVADYAAALRALDWPCAEPESIALPDVSSERFGSALRLQMTALAALLGNAPAQAAVPVTDAQSEAVPVPGGAHGEAPLTAGGGRAAGVALTAGHGDLGEAVVTAGSSAAAEAVPAASDSDVGEAALTAGGSAAAGVVPAASDSDMGEAAGPASRGAIAGGGVTATGSSGAPGRQAAATARGGEPAEDVILRHEARYWRRTATEHGLGLHEQILRRAVAAAALCGAVSEADAVALLLRVPGLRDQNEDTRLRVATWLRDLYPLPAERAESAGAETLPPPSWGSLQPDLLAEHLVAAVVAATRDLLPVLLEETSPEQDHQALTVLTRAAATRPTLSGSLAELLAQLPEIAPTAVRVAAQSEYPGPLLAALTALVERADVTSDRLAAISEAIPEQTQVLARFAVDVGLRLVADRERQAQANPDAHLPDLAMSLNNLSVRLGEAGRRAEGLAASERAVQVYERLAEANPDAYLPDLAASLNNLSIRLGEAGRRAEGLAVIERAVQIRERLAQANPDAYLPALALSLNNLSLRLGEAGRRAEGLAAIERAVEIRERLAEANPDAYLPDLAMSLGNLSVRLGEAGRRAEGLAAIERAVEVYERLAEENPDAYLPALALSLNNLSLRLGEAGRRAEGLAAIERAVEIRERLAEANPDAYLPDLAMSLGNLSIRLGEAGRRAEGLAAIERAVQIRERLAQENPDGYLPDLALSLNNLSVDLGEAGGGRRAWPRPSGRCRSRNGWREENPDGYLPDLAASLNNLSVDLGEAGRRAEGLAAIERAVQVRERLAQENPDAYLPDLALSLNNLSLRLGEAGRQAEGLAAIERAVQIRERLAQENPDAYLPDLAMSLGNLSIRLGEAGRRAEGLAAIERAVQIRERLAQENPDGYLPDLAMSLNNLSVDLGEIGRRAEGLAASERAVQVYERLAEENPDAYLPELAMSLGNLSIRLGEAGRRAEGLAAIERAVAIREDLAVRYPQAFEPDLARSLANLGDQREASGDPVSAVGPLVRAMALAERNDRQDLGDRARDVLGRARERNPAAVEAEYERLAGGPWPT